MNGNILIEKDVKEYIKVLVKKEPKFQLASIDKMKNEK
jgi:hypothetical protein